MSATFVSFGSELNWYTRDEAPMVQWLERSGYDVLARGPRAGKTERLVWTLRIL